MLNNQCIILHHSSKREAKRSYLFHLAIHKVSKDSLSHLQIQINTVTVTLSTLEVSTIFRYWFGCILLNVNFYIFDHFREKPAKNHLILVYCGDSLALWKVLSISWHVTIEFIRLYTHCMSQDFRVFWQHFKAKNNGWPKKIDGSAFHLSRQKICFPVADHLKSERS